MFTHTATIQVKKSIGKNSLGQTEYFEDEKIIECFLSLSNRKKSDGNSVTSLKMIVPKKYKMNVGDEIVKILSPDNENLIKEYKECIVKEVKAFFYPMGVHHYENILSYKEIL